MTPGAIPPVRGVPRHGDVITPSPWRSGDGHATPSAAARSELAELVWESFAGFEQADREAWMHCMWRGSCLCTAGELLGLPVEEVYIRLQRLARRLDTAIAEASHGWRPPPDGAGYARSPLWRGQGDLERQVNKRLRRVLQRHGCALKDLGRHSRYSLEEFASTL